MPALASPSTWRTHPYDFKGYLYVDRPEAIFKARVNQVSFTYPLAQITYDTVTLGAFGDVKQNMTLLVGTTEGADDLGRHRIRKAATSTLLYIGEASHGIRDGEVNLADNAYLTVLNDRRVWGIPPRFDKSTGTHYKDYDVPYTEGGRNYGSRPGPLASGGCFKAGLVNSGTSLATFQFDGTNSIAVSPGSTISAYLWNVKDGTITVGSTTTSTITATFPVGRRYVELTVTDSNGDARTCYILVVALSLTHATWKPIVNFEITEHTLLPEGASMGFVIHEDIAPVTYPDGVAAIYFEEERYGGTSGSLAGPSGDGGIKFVGWLDTGSETPTGTPQGLAKGAEFRVIATAERMRKINLLPQLADNKSSPTKWTHINTLTTTRFLIYLILWHSTVFDVAQFLASGFDASMKLLSAKASTLYEQCDELAKGRAKRLTCDQRGRLQLLADPLLLDSGSRTSTVIVSLTDDDYTVIPLDRDRHPREYWVDGRGINTGTTKNKGLFSISPGEAPGQGAARSELGQQLVADQTELNARTGHHYARVNTPWPSIGLNMLHSGDAGIEPAFMEWVQVTLAAANNHRGLALSSQRCLPVQVNIAYDGAAGTKEVEVVVFVETVGQPGATVIIPPSPKLPAYTLPQLDLYPITIWDSVTGGQAAFQLYKGTKKIAAFNTDGYVYITSDFDTPTASGGPTWARYDLGLTANAQGHKLYDFVVDPFSPGYLGTGTAVNGWVAAATGIYRITDIFGTRTMALQYTFVEAITLTNPGEWRCIEASFGTTNWVVCASIYNSASYKGTHITYTTDGTTWASEAHVGDFTEAVSDFGSTPGLYVSSKTAGKAYVLAQYAAKSGGIIPTKGYVTTNYGASWAAINPGVTGPDLTGSQWGAIAIPWHDNSNEMLAYFGYLDNAPGGSAYNTRTYRTSTSGLSPTAITPVVDGRSYRARGSGKWGIYACPEDRQTMVMCGSSDTSPGLVARIFYSRDGGTSWTALNNSEITGDERWHGAAIAGNNRDVLYAWGPDGKISYSQDFTAGLEDKRGNITADFPSAVVFVAVAGG